MHNSIHSTDTSQRQSYPKQSAHDALFKPLQLQIMTETACILHSILNFKLPLHRDYFLKFQYSFHLWTSLFEYQICWY